MHQRREPRRRGADGDHRRTADGERQTTGRQEPPQHPVAGQRREPREAAGDQVRGGLGPGQTPRLGLRLPRHLLVVGQQFLAGGVYADLPGGVRAGQVGQQGSDRPAVIDPVQAGEILTARGADRSPPLGQSDGQQHRQQRPVQRRQYDRGRRHADHHVAHAYRQSEHVAGRVRAELARLQDPLDLRPFGRLHLHTGDGRVVPGGDRPLHLRLQPARHGRRPRRQHRGRHRRDRGQRPRVRLPAGAQHHARHAGQRGRHVPQWVGASGWRCRAEAQMRYIVPPRLKNGGCIAYWSPSWSAYLDLRVIRKDGPPIAVEIDRADESTAVDELRDEAFRGRPALWIRWHGALRAELPAGVARLHLPTRSSKSPLRYSLASVAGTEAITLGPPATPEARADALRRDQQRIADEKRAAARSQEPGPTRCHW